MSILIDAIISGNLATVKSELAKGVSPNTLGQDGLTAMHSAAMANKPEIFRVLVEYGGNVNAADPHNNTPLYYAARHMGSADFIEYIVQHGANINNQNKIGQTPMHIAARLGNVDGLQALLKLDADHSIKNIQGRSPLHDAVLTNHPEEALILIEYGANLNAKDNWAKTPGDMAFQSTNSDLKTLFKLPILDKIALNTEHDALFDAVINGDQAEVIKLLDAQHNIDVRSPNGFTLLDYAVLHNDTGMVKCLVDHDAQINITTNDGVQPIHIAAMMHNQVMVGVLTDLGAAPDYYLAHAVKLDSIDLDDVLQVEDNLFAEAVVDAQVEIHDYVEITEVTAPAASESVVVLVPFIPEVVIVEPVI